MINQHELDRPLIFIPEHQIESIWETAKEYQLLDWRDIEALRVHPYYMQKALIALLFPELSAVIAWSIDNPIEIHDNIVKVQRFIAVNWSMFIVQDKVAELSIPEEHRIEPKGFRAVSIFTRARYTPAESVKRHIRDDRRTPPVDIYYELPVSESIQTEFMYVSGSLNSSRPITKKTGWVYLGYFIIDTGGIRELHHVDAEEWISYIHSQAFSHPDHSVTRSKIAEGIFDEVESSLSAIGNVPITLKQANDEIKTSRGSMRNLAQRILVAIDKDGLFQSQPLKELLLERIATRYFHPGSLAKPDPFIYDHNTGKFNLNLNAVVESGAACVIASSDRGEGPSSDGVNEYFSGAKDVSFFPKLPEGEFGLDQIYVFAHPTKIQWGDATRKLHLDNANNQAQGCNISCRIYRDDEGKHRVGAWTSFDRPSGSVHNWSCSCEYITIATANLKTGYSTDNKFAVGDGSFGYASIVLEGMEQDLKAERSIFAILHNSDHSNVIALCQTMIKRSETSMKPPRGYENASEWSGWKIISGHTRKEEYLIESDALYLPSDRSQQHFMIAWEKKGMTWKVTAYCGETEETLILSNIPVALEIDQVSDGRSDAARESGTDVINPAILTVENYKTEKYEDEVPPEQNPCKGKEYFGYTHGTARVMITGVSTVPNANHKSVMVGLGNSYAGRGGCAGWLEVRHRAGSNMESLFDMKVGMGKTTSFGEHMPCFCGNSSIGQGIAHLPAIDGEYQLAWNADTGEISVTNPRGQTMTLFMYNPEMQLARFAFDMVGQAGLGGWIDSEYGSIEVIEFNGIMEGKSHWCERR